MQGLTIPSSGMRPQVVRMNAFRAARPLKRGRMMISALSVGEKAPDFALTDQAGKTVKLSQFQGIFGKPVVLYFFPAAASPGCTKQANAFKESISAFKKTGATVLGISGDPVDSLAAFKQDLGLPYQLLSDEGNEVRKKYGVKKDLLGLLEGRETFIIGKDGVIKEIYNDQWGPEKHISVALEALAA